MFYFIDQLCTLPFPVGLIKVESDFTVRSVKTTLVGSTLVGAVISVDAYLFLAFSELTYYLVGTGIVFLGCTVLADSKQTELGSSDQEASPSAGKKIGVFLVPFSCIEVRPYSYFWWCV